MADIFVGLMAGKLNDGTGCYMILFCLLFIGVFYWCCFV
jgi:hypothetical protein